MLVEPEVMMNSSSAICDSIDGLLEKLKTSEEKLSQEELRTLLQNPNVLRYFKFNVDKYCELYKQIIIKVQNADEYATFLKNKTDLHRAIVDKDQFSNDFLEILLPTLMETCSKFNNQQVFEETSQLIQKCIFSSKEFTCFINDLFEKKKCPEKHSICKTTLKFSSSLYSQQNFSTVGFKLLFSSFSKRHKNFDHVYKMLLILTEMVGFEVQDQFDFNKIKYQVKEPTLNSSLCILNELLDVVTELNVDLEHKINNVTFSDFLKNLLKTIMALSQMPSLHCYQIFLKIIEINPLIIESIIEDIIIYVMLSNKDNYRSEYEQLMIKIFEVFNKLHRTQNLISKMIRSLKIGLNNRTLHETVYTFRGNVDLQTNAQTSYNVDDMLPKAVLDYFTECIINLASWQIINLFKTLSFHLNEAVQELPDVKEEKIYIEVVSSLTCWLLMSVRMAEHTVAENTVKKFVKGLEDLKTVLTAFGTTLLQREHNHVLMRAFLNICYNWAEIFMTIEYYSVDHDIKMTKTIDNNFSSYNLTYLHPYLNDREWCLIAERINNFGEKPCKLIMQKLMLQKLRAVLVFNDGNTEEAAAPIIRTLSSELDSEFTEIFTDKFVVTALLEKMPSSSIMTLAEAIVKDLIDHKGEILNQPHIHDSQKIAKGILCVVFAKINRLLKQKRKHDDISMRKTFSTRVISRLPSELFLANYTEDDLRTVAEIITSEDAEQSIDLKIDEKKIKMYLEILTKIPIPFCTENAQKLVILLVLALHRDIQNSNCEEVLKLKCETLVISILQHSKFTLLDLFDCGVLVKILVDHFKRSEDLFSQIAQNGFKSDTAVSSFESGIKYIKDKLKEDKCLRFATVVLNLLSKIKKSKLTAESKETCLEYKSALCQKIIKLILKSAPEDRLIEPYALVLKISLTTKDENNRVAELRGCLPDYVEHCLSNMSEVNVRGCLLLFATVLHNKNIIGELDNNFIIRLWDSLKAVTIKNEHLDEYSQLVILITTLIPNDQFSTVFGDLQAITEESLTSNHDKEFRKHLKTWSIILSTNFNPTKTNILREQLEFLLEKLILVLKSDLHKEELLEEVIQFEIATIQANHVPLTAAIMDFLLLSVSILLMKNSHDFVVRFNSGISLLENLLKYRNPLIMDRLPPFLLQYRVLLKELCLKSGSTLQQNEAQKIADCAHKLEKLTRSLVDCTKDMTRIAMYLIADILGEYELDTLYPNVKKHLNNCVYSLISLCDQHAVQYLMRVLSNASTEIFKIMYENYKKYYRFTGKV